LFYQLDAVLKLPHDFECLHLLDKVSCNKVLSNVLDGVSYGQWSILLYMRGRIADIRLHNLNPALDPV
jgi:hypothetical protein